MSALLASIPPAEGSTSTNWLPLLLGVSGMVVLYFTLRRHARLKAAQRRQEAARDAARPTPRDGGHESPPQQSRSLGARDDLQNMLADANELTQRLAAQLDAKAAMLQALIEDADDRIDALRKMPQQPPRRSDAGRAEVASSPQPPTTWQQDACRLAADGHSTIEIAQKLGREPGEVELAINLGR